MNLNRLRFVFDHVISRMEPDLGPEASSLYYKAHDRWIAIDSDVEIESSVVAVLERCASADGGSPLVDGKSLYACVTGLDAVLWINTNNPLEGPEFKHFVSNFRLLCESALNEFDATHDPKTGWLNERGTEIAFQRRWRELDIESQQPNQTQKSARLIFICALDIDHFKRINDTYLHAYGDVVLKAIALRLERTVNRLKSDRPPLGVDLCHPHGEEFNVIVFGAEGESFIKDFAEALRGAIASDVLPTDGELRDLNVGQQTGLIIPRTGDRKVSVSIGVAECSWRPNVEPNAELLSVLGDADLALASAKSDGRNRVRYFPEILKKYGRILEYDSAAGIVTLDIGEKVGVRKGQEFRVIPKKYNGETPVILGSDRGSRQIGVYPRYSVGRIVAFAVQGHVSFCRIAALNNGLSEIPVESYVEAIPLGKILEDEQGAIFGSPSIDAMDALRAKMDDSAERNDLYCVHCAIEDVVAEGEVRGESYINDCLRDLRRLLTEVCGSVNAVAQSGLGSFLGLCSRDRYPDTKVLERRLSSSLVDLDSGGLVVSAGVFSPREPVWTSIHHGPELAQLAARSARIGRKRAEVFSLESVVTVLRDARRSGEVERALSDYAKLTALGIKSSDMELECSFLEYSLGGEGRERAESHLRAAISLDPKSGYARASLAMYLDRVGRWEEAFGVLKQAKSEGMVLAFMSMRCFLAQIGVKAWGAGLCERRVELDFDPPGGDLELVFGLVEFAIPNAHLPGRSVEEDELMRLIVESGFPWKELRRDLHRKMHERYLVSTKGRETDQPQAPANPRS